MEKNSNLVLRMTIRRMIKPKLFLSITFLSILIELFFFNCRWFELIGTSGQTWSHWYAVNEMTIGVGKNEEERLMVAIIDGENLPEVIRNIKIDFSSPISEIVHVTIYMEEEGNISGTSREIDIIPGIPRSALPFLYPSKAVKQMSVYFHNFEPQEIQLSINRRPQLHFAFLRFALVWFILFLAWYLRPSSPIYLVQLDLRKRAQKIVFATIFILFSIFASWTVISTRANEAVRGNYDREAFYHHLCDALISGSLSLQITPPAQQLDALNNPYDFLERVENHIKTLHDYSYFQGKYYIYFGIIPALFIYLPIYKLTGQFPLNDPILLIAVLIGSLCLLFIYIQLVEMAYPNISAAVFFEGCLILLNTTGLIYVLRASRIYETALIFAFLFCAAGFALILKASAKPAISYGKLIIGCFLMAAAAGCRPTALFASLLPTPFFISICFPSKKIRWKPVAAIVIPYSLIGLFLGWYNYARFGSVGEFGHSYILASFEGTRYGSGLLGTNLFLGALNYLFRGFSNLSGDFPFLTSPPFVLFGFQGLKELNSAFPFSAICPLIFSPFLFFFFPAQIRKKSRLFKSFLISSAFSVLCLSGFAFAKIGLFQRYCVDFWWIAGLGSILSFFALYETFSSANGRKAIYLIMLICVIVSIVHQMPLSIGENSGFPKPWLENFYPLLFYKLKYLFSPWL